MTDSLNILIKYINDNNFECPQDLCKTPTHFLYKCINAYKSVLDNNNGKALRILHDLIDGVQFNIQKNEFETDYIEAAPAAEPVNEPVFVPIAKKITRCYTIDDPVPCKRIKYDNQSPVSTSSSKRRITMNKNVLLDDYDTDNITYSQIPRPPSPFDIQKLPKTPKYCAGAKSSPQLSIPALQDNEDENQDDFIFYNDEPQQQPTVSPVQPQSSAASPQIAKKLTSLAKRKAMVLIHSGDNNFVCKYGNVSYLRNKLKEDRENVVFCAIENNNEFKDLKKIWDSVRNYINLHHKHTSVINTRTIICRKRQNQCYEIMYEILKNYQLYKNDLW
nr:hypothetical protein Datr000026 [Darna trima granulovirus]